MEASPDAFSDPCHTSKMEVFAKIENSFSFLTIFAKGSILDVWQDSVLASEASNNLRKKLHLSCLTEFWIRLCTFAKLFPIYLLNLINIFHHKSVLSTVKSTCLMFNIFIFLTNFEINRDLPVRWWLRLIPRVTRERRDQLR